MGETDNEIIAIKSRTIVKLHELAKAQTCIDKVLALAQEHFSELLTNLKTEQAKIKASKEATERDLAFLLGVRSETKH